MTVNAIRASFPVSKCVLGPIPPSSGPQELKDELAARGLDTTGLKAVLLERLEEALRAPGGTEAAAAAQDPAAGADAEEAAPDLAADPEAPVRGALSPKPSYSR